MAGFLNEYAKRNADLASGKYGEVETGSYSAQPSTVSVEKPAAEEDFGVTTPVPGIEKRPFKGAIVRGDPETGYKLWRNENWLPVKTFDLGGVRFWFDSGTEKFYPFMKVGQ